MRQYGVRARLLAKKNYLARAGFSNFRAPPQLANSHRKPEGSPWINLEQVAGQECQMQGECLPLCAGEKSIAARPAEAAPTLGTPRRNVPRLVNASQHQQVDTQKHSSTNAGPPRRGPKPRDDAAQLRRDAASTELGARARAASTNSAVGLRAGDPASDTHGQSEESKTKVKEPRAEAPRSNKSEDSTFAAE